MVSSKPTCHPGASLVIRVPRIFPLDSVAGFRYQPAHEILPRNIHLPCDLHPRREHWSLALVLELLRRVRPQCQPASRNIHPPSHGQTRPAACKPLDFNLERKIYGERWHEPPVHGATRVAVIVTSRPAGSSIRRGVASLGSLTSTVRVLPARRMAVIS